MPGLNAYFSGGEKKSSWVPCAARRVRFAYFRFWRWQLCQERFSIFLCTLGDKKISAYRVLWCSLCNFITGCWLSYMAWNEVISVIAWSSPKTIDPIVWHAENAPFVALRTPTTCDFQESCSYCIQTLLSSRVVFSLSTNLGQSERAGYIYITLVIGTSTQEEDKLSWKGNACYLQPAEFNVRLSWLICMVFETWRVWIKLN